MGPHACGIWWKFPPFSTFPPRERHKAERITKWEMCAKKGLLHCYFSTCVVYMNKSSIFCWRKRRRKIPETENPNALLSLRETEKEKDKLASSCHRISLNVELAEIEMKTFFFSPGVKMDTSIQPRPQGSSLFGYPRCDRIGEMIYLSHFAKKGGERLLSGTGKSPNGQSFVGLFYYFFEFRTLAANWNFPISSHSTATNHGCTEGKLGGH